MKMKSTIRGFAAASVIALNAPFATAQTIPPACQRYVTALKVCGADLIRYSALTAPEQASDTRAKLDADSKGLISMFQEGVRSRGEQAMSQICASPAFTSQLLPHITNMMTALSFGDATSERCEQAYTSLVMPVIAQ